MGEHSEITHVVVDNVELPDAAAALRGRAAGRSIEHVGLIHCGEDDQPSEFSALMELSPTVSSPRGLELLVGFQLKKVDGRWQIQF